MITLREFHGEIFVINRRREYDEARQFLKSCGKPLNGVDVWLIKQAKLTCDLTRRYVIEDKGY